MKSKLLSVVIVGLILLLSIPLASCGTTPTTISFPEPETESKPEEPEQNIIVEPSATFTITDWEQIGPYVSIYYQAQNIGHVDIAYYTIYFSITCEDGSQYECKSIGTDLWVREDWTDYAITKAGISKVESIVITEFEFEIYLSGHRPKVIYEITGSAKKVDVTLNNATGGTEQYDDVYLPIKYRYNSFPDNFLYISAQNQGEYGTVKVTIYLNGQLFKTAYSSGAYVIATASGSK